MTTELDNSQDVIDSRDVIARIAELQELESEHNDSLEGGYMWHQENPELAQELATLKTLAEEASAYTTDWEYGETLIRDSYLTDYARELLEDCGDLPKNLHSYIEIDWEATARNIRMYYTPVDFDGVTYWVR